MAAAAAIGAHQYHHHSSSSPPLLPSAASMGSVSTGPHSSMGVTTTNAGGAGVGGLVGGGGSGASFTAGGDGGGFSNPLSTNLNNNNNNNNTSLFSSDASMSDLYSLLIMAGGLPDIDPGDHEYMSKLTHYLMGIGGSIVCCLGTIANAMSVAVLTRPVMKSSTYMYLAALAVCDSLVLFFTLLLVLKDTKPPHSPHQLDTFHAIMYPFVHPTAIVFQVTSIWLTLAFTVDRYIMICHPFQAEHMCRKSRARRVVIGIYIGGLVFNIPKYLENYTETREFKIANSTQVYKTYGVETTEIGQNELFRKIVHSWGYLVFVCGLPFLTLVILNAFLIRAVRESRLKGKEINPKEKHRNDTTVMLIGVIIIFLICQGPALVSRMTYAFKPGTTRNRAEFTLNEVASFLVILNSAINIVPYYLFGRKFRSEFWRIFCACCLDKDEIRRIARSYSVSIDHRRMSNYNVMEMNGIAATTALCNDGGNNVTKKTTTHAHGGTTMTSSATAGYRSVTASLSSNLNDETSPLNFPSSNITKRPSSGGDINKSMVHGGGGSSSGGGSDAREVNTNYNSGGVGSERLALPQIHHHHHQHHHNRHHHNTSPSSPSSSYYSSQSTANSDDDAVVVNVNNFLVDDKNDKNCVVVSNFNSNNNCDSSTTVNTMSNSNTTSPSVISTKNCHRGDNNSSYLTPLSPILSSSSSSPSTLSWPSSSSSSNRTPHRNNTTVTTAGYIGQSPNGNGNGGGGHRGKYMSISTHAAGHGAASNL